MLSRELYIRQRVKETLRSIVPHARLLLYGSHARGDYHPFSDWDLLVILPRKKLDASDYESISYPIYELGWQMGELFSIKIYTKDEWAKRYFTPFFKNVEKDAVDL